MADDEGDAPEAIPEPHFYDKELCCKRKGWMLFFRWLKCPFARPPSVKLPADLSALKTIRLSVPNTETRHLQIDNRVITSKYTPWDFLPTATLLQFRRAVNVYFLFQVLLLLIGNFAPDLFEVSYTPWGTLLVLLFVIGVTLITEAYDDYYRHLTDRHENAREVICIDPDTGRKRRSTWGALVPGDMVLLKNRELVPADVLVLQTDRANGKLYIETSGIDGETNLKIKSVSSEMLHHIQANLGGGEVWRKSFVGQFDFEEPNPILSFSGSFVPSGGREAVPLSFENLVLRGSEIRNTKWIIALCMYCGHQTKLVQSKRKTPSKFATLDFLINRIIAFAIVQSLVFTLIAVLVLFLATPNTATLWYFAYTDVLNIYILPGPLAFTFTFINFFSNVVPISLYVCVELANIFQVFMLTSDIEMYDAVTDTRAGTKTTNLVGELGQVSHVFSDKTGTLTQNVMRLVGCALPNNKGRFGIQVPDPMEEVNLDEVDPAQSQPQMTLTATSDMLGKRDLNQREVFGDLLELLKKSKDNKEAVDFMLALVLCHTVIVDLDDEGLPRYNAEGPDEEALVKCAALLGFVLKSTDNNRYSVFVLGELREYRILAVFPFTHDRKRMSILVKRVAVSATMDKAKSGGSAAGEDEEDPAAQVDDSDDDEVILFTKGADSIVATKISNFDSAMDKDLSAFAQSGLRTLLVAKRTFKMKDIRKLLTDIKQAKTLVGKARTEALSQCAEEVEQQMDLVGATAIEDALQEGVPETIQMLRDAGIKVWVLTGDKVDTAVNIGFSSKLLDPSMHQIILVNPAQAMETIDACLDLLAKASEGIPLEVDWVTKSLALIVDGTTLTTLLQKQTGSEETEEKLITLARLCAVVLACRVSPSQKALLLKACADGERQRPKPSSKALAALNRFRRKKRSPVTLAIGDGANDVAMIQQAKVGVGISGKEGLQAANSADFSIAQFRFLQELLFVHGRWSYRRNAVLFRYVCYSWQVLNWMLFFYLFYAMVSGQQVYVQTYYVTAFAWICNFMIVGIAWFDRDISRESAKKNPHSYDIGRLNELLKFRFILRDVFFRSLVHAVIIYFLMLYTFPFPGSLDVLGSSMFMGLFSIMTLTQAMLTLSWTWLIIGAFILVIIAYFVIISLIDILLSDAGVALLFTYDWWSAYCSTFLIIFTIVMVEYATHGLRRIFHPTPLEVLMENDRGYADKATVPKLHGITDAFEAVREGNDRVFVLPAKTLYRLIRSGNKGDKEGTTTTVPASSDRALLFQSGKRSGFVDSIPEGGGDDPKMNFST